MNATMSQAPDRTPDLVARIKRILDDEDVVYVAPELQHPREIRLARLVIDEVVLNIKNNDKGIAAWLRSRGGFLDGQLGRGEQRIADAVEKGEHWAWWRSLSREQQAEILGG